MTQLPLFPVPTSPLAHRGDPWTSKASARALKADETRLGALQRAALSFVRLKPGCTCPELAVLALEYERVHCKAAGGLLHDLEWHRQRVGRRLSELRVAGLVREKGHKTDLKSGRPCVRWWPVCEER